MFIKKDKVMNQNKKQESLKTKIYHYALIFIFSLFIIVIFTKCATHHTDGESMAPTLNNNEQILIWKTKSINRYAVVTFASQMEDSEYYIKRIVGIAGDELYVKENYLYLKVQESGQSDFNEDMELINQLPEGVLKIYVTDEVARNLRNIHTIPKNYYFVLGDNSKISKDSRFFGLINRDQIEGIAIFRYFPFKKVGFLN
ncbi:signal peptidase I [Enterococcus sp. LJL99]